MINKNDILKLESMPIEGVAERLGLRVDRHKALCPWHDDSRPSLTFDTYRNRYRCFVCDAHGGVIDLVMKLRNLNFREACAWLSPLSQPFPQLGQGSAERPENLPPSPIGTQLADRESEANKEGGQGRKGFPLDLDWLSVLIRTKVLIEPARRFLFDERHIDPRVVEWCGLTSIMQPQPCWRYGKPFYDAPSLLIPYYDQDGRLRSVQSRYLGVDEKPRFRFPRGSNCHIYNLPVLKLLKPGEPLWIAEGCSDCWALLSSGRKAIAIPSATLLRPDDLSLLSSLHSALGTTFHIFPDQDVPGERLFLQLKARLPNLERHQLPPGCKDFSDYWKNTFLPL